MKGGRHLGTRYKLEAGHELEAGITRPGSWELGAGRAGPSASWKVSNELEVKYLTSWNLYLYIL